MADTMQYKPIPGLNESNLNKIIEISNKELAEKSYVDAAVSNVTVDTTNLATKGELGTKVDKVLGKGLSTEDFTTEYKNKLEGLNNVTDEQISTAVNKYMQEHPVSGGALTAEQEAKLNEVDNKVDKVLGKGLSTEDFTTEYKNKLEGLNNVTDEQISTAVNKYMQEHPIQSGATAEQAAQIQANKNDISELKTINNIGLKSKYGTLGRWYEKVIDNVPCLISINMGSELYFKVSNTKNVTLNFKNGDRTTAICYKINNNAYIRRIIDATNRIEITGLSKTKEYIIKIKIEDILETNRTWNNDAGVIFTGVTLDEGGIFFKYKPQGKKKVLWLGDSITAGILVRGGNQPESGGASINYCALFCEAMNMDDIRIAFGYTGIMQAVPTSVPSGVPDAFGYINWINSNNYDYFEDIPDYIFVNYGTNDSLYNSDTAQFITKYTEYIEDLHNKFPNSEIICIIPFGQYYAEHIRTAVSNINYITLCETDGWTTLSGIHPNADESVILSAKLVEWFKNNITSNNGESQPIAVQSVTIEPSTLSLKVGESTQLTANITPSNASNKSVIWKSSTSKVSVDTQGLVTANSVGESIITCTTLDGNHQNSCTITVIENPGIVSIDTIATSIGVTNKNPEISGDYSTFTIDNLFKSSNNGTYVLDIPDTTSETTTATSNYFTCVGEAGFDSNTNDKVLSLSKYTYRDAASCKIKIKTSIAGSTYQEFNTNVVFAEGEMPYVTAPVKDEYKQKIKKTIINGTENLTFRRTETQDFIQAHVFHVDIDYTLGEIVGCKNASVVPNECTTSKVSLRLPIPLMTDASVDSAKSYLQVHNVEIYTYVAN